MVAMVLVTFFAISFLTNILGPIIPDLIRDFDLNLGLAGFLPFSFFVAYGVMSIPAGVLVEKQGEKKSMIIAFTLAGIGALVFAMFPIFPVAMISLFTIGLGMAILQVAINPLLRVSGGEQHFAFYSVMGQLFFGGASFLSPLVYTYLVINVHGDVPATSIAAMLEPLTPENLSWASLYWVFFGVSLLMMILISLLRFPKVELKSDEKSGSVEVYKELLSRPTVLLFFLGIFLYVGTEQGIANWMSQFLYTYHDIDPQTKGASTVSLFWGLMTVGALVGLVLLKLLDSKHVLQVFTGGTVLALIAALFGPKEVSVAAFPAMGFTISVMWSIIVSLGLNSVSDHHGSLSGILVTGIVGGAVVPFIVGWLGEFFGLRIGMSFLFLTLAYIFSIGVWAKPLISNETIFNREKDEPKISDDTITEQETAPTL